MFDALPAVGDMYECFASSVTESPKSFSMIGGLDRTLPSLEAGAALATVRPKLISRPILSSLRPSSLTTDLAEEGTRCAACTPGPTLLELGILPRNSCRVRDVDGGLVDLVRLLDRARVEGVRLLDRTLLLDRSRRVPPVGGGRLLDLPELANDVVRWWELPVRSPIV